MKKLLITLFILSANYSYGQQFQIGVKSGVGLNFSINNNSYDNNLCPAWDKEVFGRVNINRFAVELDVMHYSYDRTPLSLRFEDYFNGFESPSHTIIAEKQRNIHINSSIQYNVVGKKNARFNNYIGSSLSLTHETIKTTWESTNSVEKTSYNTSIKEMMPYIGLVNTSTYAISRQVSLLADLSLRTILFQTIRPYNYNDSHVSLQFGVAYKL